MKTNLTKAERINAKLITLVVILCVALVASAFSLMGLYAKNREYRTGLENSYQKSFYDTAANLDNIGTKLSKLDIASSDTQRLELASDIWRQASDAQSNLCQIPVEHESMISTSRFVNQAGDYCYGLYKRLSMGESLSKEDEMMIENLLSICEKINLEFGDLGSKLGTTYRFTDGLKLASGANNKGMFGSRMKDMQSNSIDYPKIIYDGPFSDGLDTVTYKNINDLAETSKEEALALLNEYFPSNKGTKYLSLAGGDLATHETEVVDANGTKLYVQLTVKGGKLLLISADRAVANQVLSLDQAVTAAEEWAQAVIDPSLKGVWQNTVGGIAYINLAPIKNNITFYPDLVKVKVALDNGEIIGMDCQEYRLNSVEREVEAPVLDELSAMDKLNRKLDVTNVRLSLIPKKGDKEVLAYEFNCYYKNSNYLVYINAATGEEEEIFKIIDSDQGAMLE